MAARKVALVAVLLTASFFACGAPEDTSVDTASIENCSYALSSNGATVAAAGGDVFVGLTTGPTCGWTVQNFVSWILVQPTTGTGSATVRLTVAPNPGPPRSATVVIAGLPFVVTQAAVGTPCSYAIDPTSATFDASGGEVTVAVSTADGCAWTAEASVDWVEFQPTSGTGPANVLVTVAPNPGLARSTDAVIAGLTFPITQDALQAPDLSISSGDIGFVLFRSSVSVAATVHNIGNELASGVVVAFASDEDAFDPVTIQSIAPGASATAIAPWGRRAKKVGRLVTVRVDPANTISPELDETNNSATAAFSAGTR